MPVSGEQPSVVFYRPRSWAGRFRTWTVLLDGVEVGTLPVGGQLPTSPLPGRHTAAATLGAYGSNELAFDVSDAGTGRAPVLVKIDITPPGSAPPPGASPWARPPALLLRQTDGFDLSRIPLSAYRPQVGNPRGPAEKAAYALAFFLLVIGLALSRGGSDVASSVVATVGAVIMVVLFFRKFLFRG